MNLQLKKAVFVEYAPSATKCVIHTQGAQKVLPDFYLLLFHCFIAVCSEAWLLDWIRIDELLLSDITVSVAEMQLRQVITLVKKFIFMPLRSGTSSYLLTSGSINDVPFTATSDEKVEQL